MRIFVFQNPTSAHAIANFIDFVDENDLVFCNADFGKDIYWKIINDKLTGQEPKFIPLPSRAELQSNSLSIAFFDDDGRALLSAEVKRGTVKKQEDGVDRQHYRCVEISSEIHAKIKPKGILTENIYIGLCGIKDIDEFWNAMSDDEAIEAGESYGLNKLNTLRAVELNDWIFPEMPKIWPKNALRKLEISYWKKNMKYR